MKLALTANDRKLLAAALSLAALFWVNIGFGILRPASGSFLLKCMPSAFFAFLVFSHRGSRGSVFLFAALLVQTLGAIVLDFDRLGYVLYALGFTAVAHVLFASAFLTTRKWTGLGSGRKLAAALFVLYAISYGSFIAVQAAQRGMLVAVVVYMICLSAGTLSAILSERPWLAAAGMLMFVLDDSVFSYHLFVSPIPPNHFITWPSFIAGQALVTLSLMALRSSTAD